VTSAAYIRVSSKGQDHAMQRLAIERAAAARGDAVCEWFAEKRTAKTLDRPELDRLRAAVRARGLSRVYVFKLDRLTRSGIRDTLDLVAEFKAAGVELVTIADGFDLSHKAADLILAVMAWAAEMELLTRRERIAARRELAEERGEAWGRPSRISPELRADIVGRFYERGDSIRTIAAAVKVPRSTVARVLEAERARRASRNPPPENDPSEPAQERREPPASR
jgi:putative DNA-invertase from lambdoid prophage Rac